MPHRCALFAPYRIWQIGRSRRDWLRSRYRLAGLPRVCLLGFIALLGAGCARPPSVAFISSEPEVLLRVPGRMLPALALSPDGALFAGGPGMIYRARLDEPHRWQAIPAPGLVVLQIFPVSRNHLYAVTRACGTVVEWDSAGGWRTAFAARPRASTLGCQIVTGLWGRNAHDIYGVGNDALVAHFDGTRWTQDSAIVAFFDARHTPTLMRSLWSVSGVDDGVVVGGYYGLLHRDVAGRWSAIPTPGGSRASCGFQVVAGRGRTVLTSLEYCIAEVRGSHVRILVPWVPGLHDILLFGATQQDGSVLFWNYAGQVVAVRGNTVRAYDVFGPRQGSAVTAGPWLFVSGIADGDGEVARIRR